MARTGATREYSRPWRANQSSSIMASTRAVVPTFKKSASSERLASPRMTCSRRYFWASQWGSSRVLTIGRLRVVSSPTSSSKNSARWVIWNSTCSAPGGVSAPTLPAPVKIWRVTKCGMAHWTTREKGTARSIR